MINKRKNHKPPKLTEWVLKRIFPDNGSYTTIGDIEEEFNNIIKEKSIIYAQLWYREQVIKSVLPFIQDLIRWRINMIGNYIKIALRNIKRHKGYSFITILGLAIGITCCTLMLLWIQDELSYDGFHENLSELYRVIYDKQIGEQITHDARGPNASGPALKEEYPEIINFTRYRGGVTGWLFQYGDKRFTNNALAVADPSFFEMLTFPFIQGDPVTALQDRYSVVITENMVIKFFGDEDPMNKVIKIDGTDFKVTGVIENIPHNSHLQFDYIFPIENMGDWWSDPLDSWIRDFRFFTFIQLEKGHDWKEVSQKIADTAKKHHAETRTLKMDLQPFKDIYLKSNYRLDGGNLGNMIYVYIFSLSALCILLIACINFMNLSTARSANRAKEIGIRKVVGAHRKEIVKQFFGESIILSFIALFFAIMLVYLFLPVFNTLAGKQLVMDFSSDWKTVTGLVGLTLLTGIIAGSYPSLYLSSFIPVKVLKESMTAVTSNRSILRKILVVAQFAIAISLIVVTIVIFNQLNFIKNKDLGFQKDHLIMLDAFGEFGRNYETAKNELLLNPDIISMTKSLPPTGFFGLNSNMREIDWEGKNPDQNIVILRYRIDYDYLNTFNMKMADGRFFSRQFSSDTSNYIINESAVKEMGIKNPVGKRFSYDGREGKIIGVIKDYHQSSLRSKILPQLLYVGGRSFTISVKINSANVQQTIKYLESKWKKFVPEYPFSYQFLDEKIDSFYSSERRIGTIFRYFTFLAIFISCLGLFGLASFMAEQRTKEIGIRKVLGASISGIVYMLSREFTKWIVIANIIAWPASYYLMDKWLRNFEYRSSIGLWIFIFSAALSLIIALITVSYQTLKAARSNPVKSLKYE